MATTRANVQNALGTPVQVKVRPITVALVALIATVAVALAIALAASGGGSGEATEPVRVTPSAPNVPTPAERNQDPALGGPGMHP
jgi:hypothetical protein